MVPVIDTIIRWPTISARVGAAAAVGERVGVCAPASVDGPAAISPHATSSTVIGDGRGQPIDPR